jgi:formylglycine-generating enzyme required for sulfatase activity
MAGNVSEWVHDRLVEDLGAGKATDPSPDQGLLGVQKGGGHGSPPAHLRAAYRQGGDPPEADWEYLGFRCARTR